MSASLFTDQQELARPTPCWAGLIPRAVREVFNLVRAKDEEEGWDYSTGMSYLEVYNEKVFDLLSPNSRDLPIREDKDKNFLIPGQSQSYYSLNQTEPALQPQPCYTPHQGCVDSTRSAQPTTDTAGVLLPSLHREHSNLLHLCMVGYRTLWVAPHTLS
ncbi:FKIF6%2C partial [Scomber scombrus]|uniref:FKIF6, partial n=1 Tax=Scomber scombrus TaxID=13677 RepID=A0AAV1QBX9_SCOSC